MTDTTEIRKRCEAATPGPWTPRYRSGSDEEQGFVQAPPLKAGAAYGIEVLGDDHHAEEGAGYSLAYWKADVEFIAHARQDIPFLLDTVDALRVEIEVERKAEAATNIRLGIERNRVHTLESEQARMERVVASGVAQTDAARARARALQDDIAKLDKMLDEERLEAYKILTRAEDAEAEVTRLRSALEKYGRHICRVRFAPNTGEMIPHHCTCGLDAVLAQARGTP